jgi:hypothetical protein
MAKGYSVEAYKDGRIIAFRHVARPATAVKAAVAYTIDIEADTVWVRSGGMAVYVLNGMFWQKHRGDAAIEAAINSANEQ